MPFKRPDDLVMERLAYIDRQIKNAARTSSGALGQAQRFYNHAFGDEASYRKAEQQRARIETQQGLTYNELIQGFQRRLAKEATTSKLGPVTKGKLQTQAERTAHAEIAKQLKKAQAASMKQWFETVKKRNEFIGVTQAYIKEVAGIYAKNILPVTAREVLKMLASVAAYTTAIGTANLEKSVREQISELDRIQVYYSAMNILQQQRITLFVNETGLLAANNEMQQVLNSVSFGIAAKIEQLIYLVMWEAFTEAATGVSPDAFPPQYLNLIKMTILRAQKSRAIKVVGKAPNWYIIADFNELFGGRVELAKGEHFGAMIMEGASRKYKQKINVVGRGPNQMNPHVGSRVVLPYRGQALAHGINVRYAFWSAIWYGNKFYSPYVTGLEANVASKGLTSTRKAHYTGSQKQMEALRKREAYWQESAQNHTKTVKNLLNKMSDKRYTETNRAKHQKQAEEAQKQLGIDSLELDYVHRGMSYTQKHMFSEPRGTHLPRPTRERGGRILNSMRLRNATINARVSYWQGIGKAPVWLFLEFGQLKYAPRVPPRGVFYRFTSKLQKAIEELVRKQQNAYASQYYGYDVSPTGSRVVAPQASEYVIQFVPRTSGQQLKVGETIPLGATAIDFRNARKTVARAAILGANVEPAMATISAAEADFRQILTASKKRILSTKKPLGAGIEYFSRPVRNFTIAQDLAAAKPSHAAPGFQLRPIQVTPTRGMPLGASVATGATPLSAPEYAKWEKLNKTNRGQGNLYLRNKWNARKGH